MNSYYLINLLIYAAVDAMACLGLSQQFGVAGVTNFGFIIFQAAGGYTAAILALPSDSANGGFQSYIGGWNLPFPLPWIGAAIVGGLIALPFTFLVGRRLRGDFAAVGLLVTAVLLNLLATNYRPLLNGDAGLSLIPQPLQGEYNPQSAGYQWIFAAGALSLCAAVYLVRPAGHRVTLRPQPARHAGQRHRRRLARQEPALAPHGDAGNRRRHRRPVRRHPGLLHHHVVARRLGLRRDRRPVRGGHHRRGGNHRGAILGAILVPVGFEEVTRYIPTSNGLPPNLIPSLQWVAIGLLIVIFLWVAAAGHPARAQAGDPG